MDRSKKPIERKVLWTSSEIQLKEGNLQAVFGAEVRHFHSLQYEDGTCTSLYKYSGTSSYTDPMGPALVCISTVEPQLHRPYGTCTSLYKYSGTSVMQTLWDLH